MKKWQLFGIFLIVLLPLIFADSPTISFVNPTPVNATSHGGSAIPINLSSSGIDIYTFLDLDGSLIGWYRLNNDSSSGENDTHVKDWSKYSTNGTIRSSNAALNGSGRFGGGFSSNGIDDNLNGIDLGTPDVYNLTGENFTISAWVLTFDSQTDHQVIFSRGRAGGTASQFSYSLQLTASSPRPIFTVSDGASTLATTSVTNDNVGNNQWYHIVGIFNGTSVSIYVNGSLMSAVTNSTFQYLANTDNQIETGIGGDFDLNRRYFNGTIDEIIVFNRSLSEAEILALYNATANSYYKNFTSLTDGVHRFTGYVVNGSGQTNNTGERIVLLGSDTISPVLNITSPLNATYATNQITINFTATDNSFVTALWFYNESTNVTYSVPTDINVSSGSHTFLFYANDSSGNLNTTSLTFFVNTSAPPTFSNYQNSPQNGSSYSAGVFYEFNVTVSSGASSLWINWNGTNYTNAYSRGGNVYSFNRTGLATGTYYYEWWANNSEGAQNSSGTKYYTVDVSGCDCGSTNVSDPCIGRNLTVVVDAGTPNGGTAVNPVFNWIFNSGGNPTYCGKFANGDYWVAPKDDVTVQITSITSNGSVTADADPLLERLGLLNGNQTYGNYNSSENIIPSLPLNYSGINSIVAAVQRNETLEGACGTSAIQGECADAYNVLTVLSSVPDNAGVYSLRPNIVGNTKEMLTFSDFNFSLMQNRSFLDGTDSDGFEDIRQRWAHSTEVFGIFYAYENSYSEGGRAYRAHVLVDDYGGGVASAWNNDMILMFSDDDSFSEKSEALASMLSYGLDLYHAIYDSNSTRHWGVGATQHPGRFMPAVFMSALRINQTYAENLRLIGPGLKNLNHTTQDNYTGPHELSQVHNGVNFPVWGDVVFNGTSWLEEESYWNSLFLSQCYDGANGTCDTNIGKKTARDPYGYVDGPPNKPGTSYMISSAGGQRSMVAFMYLMPEICEIVNYDLLIEYVDRIDSQGIRTDLDQCVTPDSRENVSSCEVYPSGDGCVYYGVTWGANSSSPGNCIEVATSPYTKVGRFVELNGTNVSYSYTSSQVESNWATIRALSPCRTMPSVSLSSPSNGSTVASASQTFAATFFDSYALINASLHLWNSTGSLINSTKVDISGTNNSTDLTVVLPYNGTFYWNYLVFDSTNNNLFNNTNYTLVYNSSISTSNSSNSSSSSSSSSGGGGGGASETGFWDTTYAGESQGIERIIEIEKSLGDRQRIKVIFNGEEHHVGVISLTDASVTINVSSIPQQRTFNIGDSHKFELDDDNYYDLLVTLRGINNSKADLVIRYLHELFVPEVEDVEVEQESGSENVVNNVVETSSDYWPYLVIGVGVLVLVIVWFVIYKSRPPHKRSYEPHKNKISKKVKKR